MPSQPSSVWTGSRIASTIFAGVVPMFLVLAFVWLRMPREWMRSSGAARPDFLFWSSLFMLSIIWGLLGVSLPIALEGVDAPWWILPLINLVVSLLPFFPIPLETSVRGILVSLLLGVATIVQYAVFQRTWLAAVCSSPYILWCLGCLFIAWRCCRGMPQAPLPNIPSPPVCCSNGKPTRRRL